MASARLKSRTPSARFVATGFLKGHVLKFHKRSKDGSGKCNAYYTGRETDHLWGVVFEIDLSEKRNLDKAEGLGNGYEERAVIIECQGGPVDAVTYLAQPTAIDNSLLPYQWYKDFVVDGANENGLPVPYVRRLRSIDTRQ